MRLNKLCPSASRGPPALPPAGDGYDRAASAEALGYTNDGDGVSQERMGVVWIDDMGRVAMFLHLRPKSLG